ncbi:MAG TPA: hypothetical protein VMS77_01565 [Conexivisphaerales archaeon]|nr:hypothetical protein [Conexivisphaerales archaeon]
MDMGRKPARKAPRSRSARRPNPKKPLDRPTKSDVAIDREDDVSRAEERSLENPLAGGKSEPISYVDEDED